MRKLYHRIRYRNFNLFETAADDDWMRAGRLQKAADQGDEEAKKKLDEMHNTKMIDSDDKS